MPVMTFNRDLADQMVDQATRMVAEIKFNGNPDQALQALQSGRCDICGTFSECLVNQIGGYLGQLDRTVKAVYQVDAEITSLRPGLQTPTDTIHPSGINLVAWVGRKSAALTALTATLENALSESRKRVQCKDARAACSILDIQMAQDQDILERRGPGLLVSSKFIRSTRVWGRDEAPELKMDDQFNGTAGESPILTSSFNPEFSPESALFEQALAIEALPQAERQSYEHRLKEIKVALIRRLISDQLAYINIAREWFSVADLIEIYHRKIGYGRIGGKAAGMVLAYRILQEMLDESTRAMIRVPDSFFLGSDVLYLFMAMNGLMHWNNQKYKSEDQIREEYPKIREEFTAGEFPPEIMAELSAMLDQIGRQPVIVRSSSLLEDNFGTSFAGKYESVFLPNQGTPEENLRVMTRSIAQIYSSTVRPDALLYRRTKGLQDYDERMAILVQTVQGEAYGRYFFPMGAGVAFSRNLYRWAPQIRKEDGFVRLVWGLGTRAMERLGNDYPRMVALSHPTLQPDDTPEAIHYYSQRNIDLIDLEENQVKSIPVHEIIRPDYPSLRYLAQIEEDGYYTTPHARVMSSEIPRLAITFDEFLRRTPFAPTMTRMLKVLEEHYRSPIDLEFTVKMVEGAPAKPKIQISLLQCRPQSFLNENAVPAVLKNHDPDQVVFSTHFMVPQGYISDIRWVLFISPEAYFAIPTQAARNELRSQIAHLNATLGEKKFICVGPGRWGTVNPDLGVFVSYSDINNSAALVELSGKGVGPAPDPSLGTHFFQDLMEANIFPLAVCLDHAGATFNRDFFYQTENAAGAYLPANKPLPDCLRLIEVSAYRKSQHLELVMDDEQGQAIAYLVPDGD